MKLRKNPVLLLFLLLGGCTALEKDFNNRNSIYSELGKINLESNRLLNEGKFSKTLTNEELKLALNEIKNSWSRGEIVEAIPTNPDSTYEIGVGQYLKIPNIGIKKVEAIGADPSHYEILNRDGIYFRALYSGEYILKLSRWDDSYSILKIKNNVKYDFTEAETYDIILNNYNSRNYQDALNGIDLYRIVYPKSYRNREMDFLALDIFLLIGDLKEAKELQKNLKIDKNLNSNELMTLFKNELKINGHNYNVEDYYINSAKNYPEFSLLIRDHILAKNIKTSIEKKFIEDLYFKTLDPNLKIYVESMEQKTIQEEAYNFPINQLEQKVSTSNLQNSKKYFDLGVNAYEKSRYGEAVIQLEKIPQSERNYETYFYLGDAYFKNEKYEKAIENYNKYLQSQEENIKKAEIRYNLAVAYDRLGMKKEAENALKKVIELFPGTSWSRKSNIYMIKLKNN